MKFRDKYSWGDLDAALHIRREKQLPVYDRLGDVREGAVTMGQIADILYRLRGLVDAQVVSSLPSSETTRMGGGDGETATALVRGDSRTAARFRADSVNQLLMVFEKWLLTIC